MNSKEEIEAAEAVLAAARTVQIKEVGALIDALLAEHDCQLVAQVQIVNGQVSSQVVLTSKG